MASDSGPVTTAIEILRDALDALPAGLSAMETRNG